MPSARKVWVHDEGLLRSILSNAPGYVMVLDRRAKILFCNRVGPRITIRKVLGSSLLSFMEPRFRSGYRQAIAAAFRGEVATARYFSSGKGSAPSWFEDTLGPLRRNGRTSAVISISQKISERVRLELAEQDLKRLRERFENVFNHSSDGMCVTDLEGRYLNVNPAYCRIVGYSKRELVGRMRYPDVTASEHHASDRRRLRQLIRAGKPVGFEKVYIRKDGFRTPVLLTVFPLKDAVGRTSSFGVIVRDLTDRKRAEEQVYEAGAREQSRLGRDLHDGIGQYLTGIALMARSLQARMATLGLHPESREAARIAVAANAAVAQTRALAQGLIPTELNDGLRGALYALAANSRTLFGAAVAVSCPEKPVECDPKAAVNLYRIAQEAVHNACRHGKAKKISIRVAVSRAGAVTMRILDDGIGLPARLKPGMGLRTMTHRAEILGGSLEIASRPARGVAVVCRCGVHR